MEVKSRVHFEAIKNDNMYFMSMPAGAPLGESYDAVFEILLKIVELSQSAADKMKAAKEKEEEEKADGGEE
jgi:hypothetical protein